MFYIDPLYIIFSLPAIIIGFGAQWYVHAMFRKYSRVKNRSNITGLATAQQIASGENFSLDTVVSNRTMGDFYNPASKVVNLSAEVAQLPSIASVAIACHEFGHVEQHQKGSTIFSLRSVIAPSVNAVSTIGYFVLIVGVILSSFNLSIVGIILFSLATVFSFVTLPIELDASNRAMKFISKYNLLIGDEEKQGAKKVLNAAALTYVAGTIQSASTLVYFLMRVGGLRND